MFTVFALFIFFNKSLHYSAIQRDKDTITNCTILIHYKAEMLDDAVAVLPVHMLSRSQT